MLSLLLVLASGASAAAGYPPAIDDPVRTGVSSPGDVAVVIDVSENTAWGRLPSARRDADVFALTAQRTLGIPEATVFALHTPSANLIRSTLRTAGGRASTSGRIWIYYTGHETVRASGEKLLLIAGDTPRDASAWGDTVLPESEIQALATLGGGELVLMVDACNPLEGRAAVPDVVSAKVQRGVYVRATSPGETAQTLAGTGHGAFSYFWLAALRGQADGEPEVTGTQRERDGVVTFGEAWTFTERRLADAGIASQTPEKALFAVTSDTFELMQCGSAGCELEPPGGVVTPTDTPPGASLKVRRGRRLIAATATTLLGGVALAAGGVVEWRMHKDYDAGLLTSDEAVSRGMTANALYVSAYTGLGTSCGLAASTLWMRPTRLGITPGLTWTVRW